MCCLLYIWSQTAPLLYHYLKRGLDGFYCALCMVCPPEHLIDEKKIKKGRTLPFHIFVAFLKRHYVAIIVQSLKKGQ